MRPEFEFTVIKIFDHLENPLLDFFLVACVFYIIADLPETIFFYFIFCSEEYFSLSGGIRYDYIVLTLFFLFF